MTVLDKEHICEALLFSVGFESNTLMTAIRDLSMTKIILENELLLSDLIPNIELEPIHHETLSETTLS